MDKRDLVITAITNYNFRQIAPWVNSLDRSGFTGIKAVVAYNVDGQTLNELAKRGYSILAFQKDESNGNVTYPNKDFSVVVDRFLHYYLMLDNPENAAGIRCVIATDAKDVVFQHNPSTYLDTLAARGFKLVASSEGIAYKDEVWGANNLRQSFGPLLYEKHKHNIISNCGVIAGDFATFLGLSKIVYIMSHGTVQHVPGGGGPDQAALNLLLSTPAYQSITDFVTHEHPWAAQLGTTMDPNKIDAYRLNINEALPVFDEESGLVTTPDGIPYSLVHQWDRVPEVKRAVERLYL